MTCSTSPGDARAPRGAIGQRIGRVPGCFRGLHLSNAVCQLRAPNQLPSNVVPVSQYLDDVKNGTLPSVAFIETGYLSQRDEHPSSGTNVQVAPLMLRA